MINRWFLNFKNYKKIKNDFHINGYFELSSKKKLNKEYDEAKQNELKLSAEVWRKNCVTRTIFVYLILIFAITVFLIGLAMFISFWFLNNHKEHIPLNIAGIIMIIFPILLLIVLYFSDNWANPFMYAWSKILNDIEIYLINKDDLPRSIYYFYFKEKAKERKDYAFFYEIENNGISESLSKYIKNNLIANEASFYKNPLGNEFNNATIYEYWGDINIICEWANFISKLFIWMKE